MSSAAAGLILAAAAAGTAADPDPQRRDALVHLLRHDCGSCHGMTLAGGLGPALTAKALRDKAEAALEATILHGRPGTPMPPWRGMLSDDEVRWMVRTLKSGTLE
jgi:cytochrome c55X